jgi:hypothetical protein
MIRRNLLGSSSSLVCCRSAAEQGGELGSTGGTDILFLAQHRLRSRPFPCTVAVVRRTHSSNLNTPFISDASGQAWHGNIELDC